MFAGAAREAVFAKPEVIRRINADFIPVALKAGLVNNPPGGEEGALYREIGRSKPAPQGICVVNSAGKVLDWVLMFDDDASVLTFLDHASKRFAKHPDATRELAAERYMKYPSARLEDVADNQVVAPIVKRHAPGAKCPATPRFPQGTVAASVFGRALDAAGKPLANPLRQEHYVEDRFHVSPDIQEALANALAKAGLERFPIGDDLARLLVNHAYLGQLDVNPIAAPGGAGDLKMCEFWARKVDVEGSKSKWMRIEGRSEAAGKSTGEGNDGRLWQHDVTLAWNGMIEIRGLRINRLLLLAHGSERLKWGNALQATQGGSDVARLPAGHSIDLATEVRYGIIGEPIPADSVGLADPIVEAPGQIADEARRQLSDALGPPFRVFRDNVQEELKLSGDQRRKLEGQLRDTVRDTTQLFLKLERLKPEDRERELHSYRQDAHQRLATFLKHALRVEQLERLRQLELQLDGPFALGRSDVIAELKLGDEQRNQFMTLVQEMQARIEPAIKAAQARGNPEVIRPKVMAIRKEYGVKIEAILTQAQNERWREMLGAPFERDD